MARIPPMYYTWSVLKKKLMTPSLLELKVTPSFCFAFKIPDDVTATNKYSLTPSLFQLSPKLSNTLSPLYCTIVMTRSSYDHIMSTARQLICGFDSSKFRSNFLC